MLRALRVAAEWRRPEDWVRPALLGCAAAVLARVQPLPGVSPFALAFFAAALAAGEMPVLLLAGCLTGVFHREGLQAGVAAGCAAVLAAGLSARWLCRKNGAGDTAVCVAAGLGALAAGAVRTLTDVWAPARIAGAVALAAAGAPFFSALLKVKMCRRHLMPEERTGLTVFLMALLVGLTTLWTPLGVTAAYVTALAAAPLGAGAGACVGVSAGCGLLLAGVAPARCAVVGVCGMLLGMASRKRRWSASALLCLSAPVLSILAGGAWTDAACAPAAGALFLAVPERWVIRARCWLAGEAQSACDPDRLALRLRAESERRLRAMSDAFGELSESYRVPVDVPDEQTLIAGMRESLCENCPNYAQCWVRGDNQAVRFLCQLISAAIDWAAGGGPEPLFGEEMPPDVLRLCRRGRTIPARLGPMLEDFALRRRSEMKRGAMNQLISAQFLQARMLLGGMAESQARPLRVRGQQAARARAALDRAGIQTADVMALRGARSTEIVATLARGRWTAEQAAKASAQLSGVFGRAYAAGAGGGAEMRFVRLPRLRVTAAAGCHSCRAGVLSGDSHLIQALEGDRVMLILSDGMGSGEAAARESAQVVRLLGRFLEAEVERELALETVNELMLARTETDMFATVDLCVVDLAKGEAEFSKLAACRSLILRDGEVLEVEGGRLPLGILEKVEAEVCRVEVKAGDVIVMASDGVVDAVSAEVLTETLMEFGRQPPQMLAETLLRVAETRGDAKRRDDMTVLCARVSRQTSA